MDLDNIRQEIDKIDDQIVQLLEERMHLVEGVVIFEKVKSRVGNKKYEDTIVETFSDILKRSRDYQDKTIK